MLLKGHQHMQGEHAPLKHRGCAQTGVVRHIILQYPGLARAVFQGVRVHRVFPFLPLLLRGLFSVLLFLLYLLQKFHMLFVALDLILSHQHLLVDIDHGLRRALSQKLPLVEQEHPVTVFADSA